VQYKQTVKTDKQLNSFF